MFVFAVISTIPDNKPVADAIMREYATSHQVVSPTVWLIADKGVTAQEVSRKLKVKSADEPNGLTNMVVIQVSTYFGHASKAIWDWMAAKFGAS